jgi:hypothetical protein
LIANLIKEEKIKIIRYIKNMFESNITNRLIESLNNKIKSVKRATFGY